MDLHAGSQQETVRRRSSPGRSTTAPTCRQRPRPSACNVTCPCTIFGAAAPAHSESTDATPVEVGVRFKSDVNGWITGVRFYKGPDNTGVHTGSLWTDSGTLLATATFTGETADGWQTVSFGAPVPVTAGHGLRGELLRTRRATTPRTSGGSRSAQRIRCRSTRSRTARPR